MQDNRITITYCPKGLEIDTKEPSPCVGPLELLELCLNKKKSKILIRNRQLHLKALAGFFFVSERPFPYCHIQGC